MDSQTINKILAKAVSQIEFIEADNNWILSDLKKMRVAMRIKNFNADALIKNKEYLIKQVWKLGKAHELLYKGLLHRDGSLSTQAISYLKKQKDGKIPSGELPGQVYIELAQVKKR